MHVVTRVDQLRNEIEKIVRNYELLLEAAASPLIATPRRWQQCRSYAEAVLSECADYIARGTKKASSDFRGTVELGARRAAEKIPARESVRATLLLWQAACPVFEQILCDPSSMLATNRSTLVSALDYLACSLMGGLLYETMAYDDPRLISEILADQLPDPGNDLLPSDGKTVGLASLTAREYQVLTCAAKAITNYEIGRELRITETTVKKHLRNIFAKLGANSRMEAVQKAGLGLQFRG